MKIALFWDSAINIDSYYVKDGEAFSYWTDKPFTFHHSISSKCFPVIHNYQWFGETGTFLNLSEWVDRDLDFPDLDVDLIFYACERQGLDNATWDDYSIERLKRRYPNAKIIGSLKEVNVKPERVQNRLKFLKSCDDLHSENPKNEETKKVFSVIEDYTGMKIKFFKQPQNINYYYENFYSDEKINGIYAYMPNPIHRRGRTYEFANYIGDKYNLPVKTKPLNSGQDFDHLGHKEFIELWSPYFYHFNLDPTTIHPGTQVVQVAMVGSINIGGLNQHHHIYYPETATIDEVVLEKKIVEYINNPEKRFEVIENAWKKVNELNSLAVIKKHIEECWGKIND